MSELEKKKYRSLIDVPIKVEMQPVKHQKTGPGVLTVEDLAEQIEEARKGKAKVDNQYVGYEDADAGHLFEYKIDYVRFLDNMAHIIKKGKEMRERQQDSGYRNQYRVKTFDNQDKTRKDDG